MMNSPWRDRPIGESLKFFDEMKRGMIEEGKATLRLKQDMQSNNKNMCDLIAYRIKVSEIFRTSSFLFLQFHHLYREILTFFLNSIVFLFFSSVRTLKLVTSGAYTRAMTIHTALWIRLRTLHIRLIIFFFLYLK